MDVLPAAECADSKSVDPDPVPHFPESDLDNSEVCDYVPKCTDSPKLKGSSFQLPSLHHHRLYFWICSTNLLTSHREFLLSEFFYHSISCFTITDKKTKCA